MEQPEPPPERKQKKLPPSRAELRRALQRELAEALDDVPEPDSKPE